jgi:hypothetical protein
MEEASARFFRLAKGVEVATLTVTKEQALDVQYQLAKDTPVDVGTARSNWRISVGRPLVGKIAAYSPYPSRYRKPYGSGGNIGEGANLAGVISQGRNRLASYKSGSIYVTNALPYIGALDNGHSRQTSPGFIAHAVYAATSETRTKIEPIFNKEFSK